MKNFKRSMIMLLCTLFMMQSIFTADVYANDKNLRMTSPVTAAIFDTGKTSIGFDCSSIPIPDLSGPKKINVQEVLPDVWMIGGYISDNFFIKPPSCNIYVLRDQDTVYIIDTGKYSKYKQKILDIINKYKDDGVVNVKLLITQGHFDHDSNNDVVRSTGLNWEFLLPEDELATMDSVEDFMRDIDNLSQYEDVYQTMFPDRGIGIIVKKLAKTAPRLARLFLQTSVSALMSGGNNMADYATILRNDQKVEKTYGSVTLHGWELGRFFIIHDSAHSPGHICIYDSSNKMILAGDVTIEINPAFLYSSMNGLIDISGKLKMMAEEGYIEYAGDSHRSPECFEALFKRFNTVALDRIQLIDFARNRGECIELFGLFNTYYTELKNAVFVAHNTIGRATVGDIVNQMLKSENKYVKFKAAMTFPELPSRMDILVANVLKEAGAVPVKAGKKIYIDPVQP